MTDFRSEQEILFEQLRQKSADEILFALAQAITEQPFPLPGVAAPAITDKARAALKAYINALHEYRKNHPVD